MPELANIFRDWKNRLPFKLSDEQYHAIRDICACRTAKMQRGSLYLCPNCQKKHFGWQSCGNRNCPKCGSDKITKWLLKRQRELLPVNYFMVTFTLPSELRTLCLKFPEKIYSAFFAASSGSLKELALDKRYLGAKIGMMGTLHTWRRDGEFHPHIHFLVPSGGLSKNREYWIYPKNRDFLVAVKPLMKLFRGKFKSELKKTDLSLEIIKNIPSKTWVKDWVTHCRNVGNCLSSFKYLGTYMQRVFISNNRIEHYDGETVVFKYKQSGTGNVKRRPMTSLAFIVMFLRHILPSGFQKTRYYGLLGSANKKSLHEIRTLILTSRNQPPSEPEDFVINKMICRNCGTELILSNSGARGPPEGAIVL